MKKLSTILVEAIIINMDRKNAEKVFKEIIFNSEGLEFLTPEFGKIFEFLMKKDGE